MEERRTIACRPTPVLVFVQALVLLLACGGGKDAPQSPAPEKTPVETHDVRQYHLSEGDVSSRPRRVAIDLLDNRYLAHLHRDGVVIPLNDPGVFKYTRGGWRSQSYPVKVKDRQLLRAGGHSIRFFVPVSDQMLEKNLFFYLALEQPHRDQRVSLVINGMRMRAEELERGFQVLKVNIPSRLLHPGENEIKLFFAKSRRIDKRGEGAADLRWMALTTDEKTPLRHMQDIWRTGGGRKPSLNFKDLHSWRWFSSLPEFAQLDVRWDDGGDVPVIVHGHTREGHRVEGRLIHHEKGAASFDLSTFSGSMMGIAELNIERKRPVILTGAAVTVPYVRIKPTPKTKPRHIFVFNLAGLRRDALRIYNPESPIETPNIDALAQRSVVFNDVMAQSPRSIPANASILTGTYPAFHQHLSVESRIGRKTPFLPSLFLNAGWRPVLLSSKGFASEKWGFLSRKGFIDVEVLKRNLSPEDEKGLSKWLGGWLEEHKEDRIFAYVTTRDPFILFRAHEGIIEKYETKPYRRQKVPDPITLHFLAQIRFGGLELRARDRERLKAMYQSEVAFLDKMLGVFLKELETKGILDDSLIVVTSDHGEELFDHDRIGHGRSLHAEQVRVPLIVSFPKGLPVGTRVSQEVESIDIAPTLLGFANIQSPEGIQGADLHHLIRHASMLPPRPAFAHLGEVEVAVQMNGAKMVLRYGSQYKLYDLVQDPGEKEDLYGQSPILERALKDALGFHLAFEKVWRKARHGLPTNQSAIFHQDSRTWWDTKR